MEYYSYIGIRNGLIVKINGVNSNYTVKSASPDTTKKSGESDLKRPSELNSEKIDASVYKANFASCVSFSGKRPHEIKNAFMVGKSEDTPIKSLNGGYLVDKKTMSTVKYGKEALKFLKKTNHFDFDTQVIFPKGVSGSVLTSDGKTIKLTENSAVMVNADTDVKITPDSTSSGYPMIVSQVRDYDWYERYGSEAITPPVKNKYEEISQLNSHFFNGAFSTDMLIPKELTLPSIWNDETGIGPSWKAKGKMIEVLNENRDKLDEEQLEDLDKLNKFIKKLHQKNIIKEEDNGYVKFRYSYAEPYQSSFLKENGLTDEEIGVISPLCQKMRIAKQNSAAARRDKAEAYPPELIQKLKDSGLIYNAKKDDGFIYWKEPVDNEKLLENQLIEAEFTSPERHTIIDAFKAERKSGYDYSGHKYSDEGIAVYRLDEKCNNWSLEETNHITNATAPSSSDGKTQSIGVSLVQQDKTGVFDIDQIRKGEQLHFHPDNDKACQNEVYLVTKGSAALGIRRNGELITKVLNEGDLAVIEPGVAHYVAAVKGEYEHIVTQVPSAFQYGFGFKNCVQDIDPSEIEKQKNNAIQQLGGTVIKPVILTKPKVLPNAASP